MWTPAREVLHALEREGLAKALPRIGYVVRLISEEEISELCEIRLALESLVLRWALQRDPRALRAHLLQSKRDILDFGFKKRQPKG